MFERQSIGIESKILTTVVRSVVCDELENVFDVIEDNILGKRQQDIPLLLLHEDLFPVLFEEVFIFIETDCKEVKEISDIEIIGDGTEVSGELGIEIQHVFQISRLALTLLNAGVEHLDLLSENLYLLLSSHHETIAPDIKLLEIIKINMIRVNLILFQVSDKKYHLIVIG